MKTLREQMNDAMILRRFATRTQESYLVTVRALAKYYHRSPDLLTAEEIEAYHLHLIVERKLAYASVNQSASACRFLFDKVLKRPQARFDIPMAKAPKTLPRVLSRDEVSRLFVAAPNRRARTLLMTTYAAGLRVSELCALQLSDIESAPDRMCIKVRQGKGGKDRYTMLSPQLLQTLRDYWHLYRPRIWLFPGPSSGGLIDIKVAQRIYGAARDKAGLGRMGGIHTLRHCFATHLLESGVDIHTIQRLLGHDHVSTTTRYFHLAQNKLTGATSPLELRDSANGSRKKVMRLEACEFIGRFLLHMLPGGFKRIRHYGLLGAAHKAANLAAARVALEAPAPDPVVVESVEAFMLRVAGIEWLNCPCCREGQFQVLQGISPSGVKKEIFRLPRAPPQKPS